MKNWINDSVIAALALFVLSAVLTIYGAWDLFFSGFCSQSQSLPVIGLGMAGLAFIAWMRR